MEEQQSIFTNLKNNLTNNQKIIIFVFIQFIIIIMFIAIINWAFSDKTHVEIQNDGELSSIPAEERDDFKTVLWNVISNNYDDVDESVIDDVVVRDGSYNEEENDSVTTASFLIDIDSLKQTYDVSIQWSSEETLPDGIDIECPPISQMKYKETFCRGMYNNTNSFDLYFPYSAYKEGKYDECDEDSEECYDTGGDSGMIYYIEGDEENGTITIESSVCDVDRYNGEALEYIKNETPFYNNPSYTIKYTVNEMDVICD